MSQKSQQISDSDNKDLFIFEQRLIKKLVDLQRQRRHWQLLLILVLSCNCYYGWLSFRQRKQRPQFAPAQETTWESTCFIVSLIGLMCVLWLGPTSPSYASSLISSFGSRYRILTLLKGNRHINSWNFVQRVNKGLKSSGIGLYLAPVTSTDAEKSGYHSRLLGIDQAMEMRLSGSLSLDEELHEKRKISYKEFKRRNAQSQGIKG